ncbi:MAG: serine hydrolase [Candidatus Thorarchaeota archaeon]|nr:MAG: serine hydrolase [Candidatus Thorarchaeota archaeon]
MNGSKLQEMLDYIDANPISINAIVIVRRGFIVLEQYYSFYNENTTSNIFSCTKSITSTAVGLAIEHGFLDNVSQKVLDFFPNRTIENLDSWKESITIEDLLTMQAGFDWDDSSSSGMSEYNQMIVSDNWVQFVLDRPMANTPGTIFNYNSGASHLLSAIVQNATGMKCEDFVQEYLYEPLGISRFTWSEDPHDISIGGNTIQLSAKDMARFGYLFLREGNWNGEQVISADWVSAATSTHTLVGGGTTYGYQWWITPSRESYSARGYAGQFIFVVPEYDLVVVFKATSGWNNIALQEWIIPSLQSSANTATTTGFPDYSTLAAGVVFIVIPLAFGIAYFKRKN